MPEKRKENLIQIKKQYDADLAFTEGKFTKDEFEREHRKGSREEWIEIPYVSKSLFFLESLLKMLPIAQRLIAVKDMYGYSYNDIRKIGGFGGSIHQFFKYEHKKSETVANKNDDRLKETNEHTDELKEPSFQRARLSIILDIPFVYVLKDKPNHLDIVNFYGLEFKLAGQTLLFHKIPEQIFSPIKRSIKAYKVENRMGHTVLFPSENEWVYMRLDLRKEFYTVEFYLRTHLDIDLVTINRIVKFFKSHSHNICVIISRPLLSDSFKISIVATYIKEQKLAAQIHQDELLQKFNGSVLYPYNFNFNNVK